jgi:hypothetical protein
MIARALPLAVCLLWMAYQSQFSSAFFLETVHAGLADIQAGLDALLEVDMVPARTPAWRTASTQ